MTQILFAIIFNLEKVLAFSRTHFNSCLLRIFYDRSGEIILVDLLKKAF